MSPKSVFILLFSLNLLNYIDRQILFSVFPLIKADLNLSDAQLGVLASAFMFVYMIAAPFVGFIADRTPRQYVISVCAFLWSAATMLSGSAKNYFHLFAARSFIGIGEAGFTSVSPSFWRRDSPPKEGPAFWPLSVWLCRQAVRLDICSAVFWGFNLVGEARFS